MIFHGNKGKMTTPTPNTPAWGCYTRLTMLAGLAPSLLQCVRWEGGGAIKSYILLSKTLQMPMSMNYFFCSTNKFHSKEENIISIVLQL